LRAGYLLASWAFGPHLALAHAPVTTTVQFDREVVRILDNHCIMCHEAAGPAFPLVTYEQTYASRWKIRLDVLARHMAPWGAVPGYGDFINSNELTQREIDFLVSWAESFGPRNNGGVYTGVAATAAAPEIIQAHFDFDRWTLGKPDLQLALPANAIQQRAILDPKLTSDRWLRGWEYKPADRRAVHAVTFTIQETGQWIGSWTPWYGFVSLPSGLAYRLPARCHIVAVSDSHGSSGPETGRGSLGLYFSDQAPRRPVTYFALDAKSSDTPAKWVATRTLDADTNILSLQPQLNPGVQSIEVSARTSDGATQVLLFAKDIPVEWPTPYLFRKPVSLVKGTELTVTEHYAGNTAIPSTGLPVLFGAYEGATLASDAIQSDVVVNDTGTHLENIKVTRHAK
jgi:cytochrome c5